MIMFVIGGTFGMNLASNRDDFRFIMLGIICYGAVYIMFKFWSELPGKVMLASAAVVVALAFFAQIQYVPYWLYEYAQIDITQSFGYFRTWAALIAVVGVPLMTLILLKYDDDVY